MSDRLQVFLIAVGCTSAVGLAGTLGTAEAGWPTVRGVPLPTL